MTSDNSQPHFPVSAGSLDGGEFEARVRVHRRELQLHCYRMLGSLHEADDAVQETFLRAWRSLNSFEGRSTFRAWLYRIATNVCLNALASRVSARRILPEALGAASNGMPTSGPATEIEWLDPYPDTRLEEIPDFADGPEVRFAMQEAVQLAFVAAIQFLPPSQRAILLLRDVLGWSAEEAAALLDTSVAAVNSRLQRARATLTKHFPDGRPDVAPELSSIDRALLDRYVEAWQVSDLDGFVSLLKEDATYTMPPWREWFKGRADIHSFFKVAWRNYSGFRLSALAANGRPGFAVYSRGHHSQEWQPHSIQLLFIEHGKISCLSGFRSTSLFASFGMSPTE